MAYDIQNFCYTLEASADLSTKQYFAVVVDTNGRCAIAGAGVQIDGFLQNKPETLGEASTIYQKGITRAVLGATVTAGDLLETDANGNVITQTAGVVIGRALQGGDASEIVSILLY